MNRLPGGTKRILIGLIEKAGWPISQPPAEEKDHDPIVLHGDMRWLMDGDMNVFTLQTYNASLSKWVDVPVVMSNPKQKLDRMGPDQN